MILSQSKVLNQFKNLTHAFSTKKDGNLAFHVGDDPLDVIKNHENLAKKLFYKKNSLIHMNQIHSNNVYIVKDEDKFDNPITTDALVTNKQNIPLMVMVADCCPILFFDNKEQVIAVAHAGRAGAFLNIVKNTINTMVNEFNSLSEDIYISIGSNIKKCCYEVGIEIYEESKNLNLNYAIDIKTDRYYLNIDKILLKQLLACGVKEQNIEISQECTSCNTHKYYSYRAEGQTKRFSGIIMLK